VIGWRVLLSEFQGSGDEVLDLVVDTILSSEPTQSLIYRHINEHPREFQGTFSEHLRGLVADLYLHFSRKKEFLSSAEVRHPLHYLATSIQNYLYSHHDSILRREDICTDLDEAATVSGGSSTDSHVLTVEQCSDLLSEVESFNPEAASALGLLLGELTDDESAVLPANSEKDFRSPARAALDAAGINYRTASRVINHVREYLGVTSITIPEEILQARSLGQIYSPAQLTSEFCPRWRSYSHLRALRSPAPWKKRPAREKKQTSPPAIYGRMPSVFRSSLYVPEGISTGDRITRVQGGRSSLSWP
jgi:hypothetical protein